MTFDIDCINGFLGKGSRQKRVVNYEPDGVTIVMGYLALMGVAGYIGIKMLDWFDGCDDWTEPRN